MRKIIWKFVISIFFILFILLWIYDSVDRIWIKVMIEEYSLLVLLDLDRGKLFFFIWNGVIFCLVYIR